MPFTDDIIISKPVTKTMIPIIILVRYSILPNPNGWFLSGFFWANFVPMIVINEDDESVKLLTASDVIAIEPDVIPIIIFIPAKMRLVIIPKIDIFTICFSLLFFQL